MHDLLQIEHLLSSLDIAMEKNDIQRIPQILNELSVDEHNNPLRFGVQLNLSNIIKLIYRAIKSVSVLSVEELAGKLINAGCPFPYVVALGDLPVTEYYLANKSADINERLLQNQRSALHVAAHERNYQQVEILLKYGADVNCRDEDDSTPLHLSMSDFGNGNCFEIVKLLVKNNALVNLANDMGNTAVLFAASCHGLQVLSYLVEEVDGDLTVQNRSGKTALHLAAINQRHPAVLDYLLDKKVDLEVVDRCNCTALHWAAKNGRLDYMKKLLRHGAAWDKKDVKGRTPLAMVVWHQRCTELGRMFFERGADLNGLNELGEPMVLKAAVDAGFWSRDIVAQIAKLEALNQPRSQQNLELIQSRKLLRQFYDRCNLELTKMKEKSFYGNITYFDILTKKLSVIEGYARNSELVHALEWSNCDQKFPIYSSYLKARFQEQVRKQILVKCMISFLNDCMKSLNSSVVLLDKIVSYLSHDDIIKILRLYEGHQVN